MLNNDLNSKILNMIDSMTKDEKISFLASGNSFSLKGIASQGVPSIKLTSESKGCIKSGKAGTVKSIKYDFTCFPSFLLTSCSFDRELLKEMGETIAKECLTNGISAYLLSCSVLDSPYYGRGYELLGEDPYLVGELVAALSVGLQTYGIFAVLTDYALYIGENDKFRKSVSINETYFRERYLLPFEIAITKSNPRAVMVSSFKLNDTYITESNIIGILKEELGFEGIVLSEWGGINDRVKALNAGVHIAMSSADSFSAITDGLETESTNNNTIDERVKDILCFIEDSKKSRVSGYQYDKTFNHKIAEKIAEESICLLKNEDNILPLSHNDTIAVLGCATNPTIQGSGSSHIPVNIIDDPLFSMREISPSLTGANILYSEGYDKTTSEIRRELVYEACRTVMSANVVVLFLGFSEEHVTEGKDYISLDLPENQVDLINSVYEYNKNIVVVINTPTCINMPWIDKVKALIDVKIPGEAAGPAISNILFGIVNPSGKLSCEYLSLFPFGYGLSYTEFVYSDIYINYDNSTENYYISFNLANIGKVFGKEIVLLYTEMDDTDCRYKRLIGFCKPGLEPGEKKKVTFKIHKDDLSLYDANQSIKVVYSGSYRFMVCASKEDVRLDATVYVKGDNPIESIFSMPERKDALLIKPYIHGEDFTIDSTINELLLSRMGKRVYPILVKWTKEIMGLYDNHPTYKMNMELFLNTPLKRLADMSGGKLSKNRIQGLVDLCNGKTLVGIGKVLLNCI